MTKEELLKIKSPVDPYHIEEYTEEDEYGYYMTGTFKYGKTFVLVTRRGDKWHLSMKCDTPLGLHKINEIRELFIPDKAKMVFVIPPRSERKKSNNFVTLLEWT